MVADQRRVLGMLLAPGRGVRCSAASPIPGFVQGDTTLCAVTLWPMRI